MNDTQHQDGYPWTWEPAALTAILLLIIAVLAMQIGRTTALLISGAGLLWPTSRHVVTSIGGIIGGDTTAGLPSYVETLAPMWLVWTMAALAAAVMCGATGWAVWRLRGRAVKGMASTDQARHLLGLRRLRRTRRIIRPDLYPKARR
ncbi:hypothetical protein [Tessaracoccus antarcticus]|uniref:Conjugal transfer protein n=1 Tax=Tessaracoccus antarcticus TaxID=2479848 RepID=A0A3M0FX36_9ACTN|nr:hypothetical protein [Tessaracoccus antarcticus]RMB57241.1 hypothetical protein EAX62_15990 [Tessaracoccus antarcticus]